MNNSRGNRILNLLKIPIVRQFVFYTGVGAVATGVDWGTFYIVNTWLGTDHKIAVTISFTLGATTNYTLNKILTFKDKTRQIVTQLGVYISISLLSLFFSVALMYLLVDVCGMHPMPGRMLTTLIMLFANFFMHKLVTFNKAIYDKIFQTTE